MICTNYVGVKDTIQPILGHAILLGHRVLFPISTYQSRDVIGIMRTTQLLMLHYRRSGTYGRCWGQPHRIELWCSTKYKIRAADKELQINNLNMQQRASSYQRCKERSTEPDGVALTFVGDDINLNTR
jgi:hypothetical protein